MSNSVYIFFEIFKNPGIPADHTTNESIRIEKRLLQSILVSLTHYYGLLHRQIPRYLIEVYVLR